MKIPGFVKTGIEIIVSIGVGAIVGNAVVATTPIGQKLITKICTKIGSVVLSSMIGEKASDYVNEKIEDTIETVTDLMEENQGKEETEA